MAMAVFRREGRRLLPSIAARPIAAIRSPLSPDQEEGFLGVRSISTQVEALNGVIRGALEPVLVKLETDISKSKESQAICIINEFEKVRAEQFKLQAEIVTMHAERQSAHQICIQKIREDRDKTLTDLAKELAQLKVEFQSAKLQATKYAVATLASVVAVGMGLVRLMN